MGGANANTQTRAEADATVGADDEYLSVAATLSTAAADDHAEDFSEDSDGGIDL